MSNQYSRFARDPNGGTVLDDIITTESMIRSTDFQQKLAAARAMREKVMAQREREAALARRKNKGLADPQATSPSFIRAGARQSLPDATMPELKGPVLQDAPRRPSRGPSFQLLADPEPSATTDAPLVRRVKDVAQAAGQAGRVASRDAAHWIKDKTAKALVAAPSMAKSKDVAQQAMTRLGGIATTGRQNGATAMTAAVSRARSGMTGLAGSVAPLATGWLRVTLQQPLPYRAMAAGLACLLGLGVVLLAFSGSQPASPLAAHQARAVPLETPLAQDMSVAYVIPSLVTPSVAEIAQDRPTPKLASYALANVEADAVALPDLVLTPQAIGPVAANSAPAKTAWVPAQRFEAQVAEALSIVSRSGFQPGSLPNSTIVDGDTPRLPAHAVASPETTAIAVAAPAKLPSTKYAVKRSLRPLPRELAGQ